MLISGYHGCFFIWLVIVLGAPRRRYLGKKAKAQVMWALVDGLYGFLGWPKVVHMSSEKRAGKKGRDDFFPCGGGERKLCHYRNHPQITLPFLKALCVYIYIYIYVYLKIGEPLFQFTSIHPDGCQSLH